MQRATSIAQATTASYVDLVGSELQAEYARTFSYILQCTVQNSKYKVMISNDGALWNILGSEGSIAKDAQAVVSGDLLYQYIKIMIIEDVAGGSIAGQGVVK